MRLTRIEIENFKGIGERQVIDLKPITLLFGPNSAGKSTILQALHYVREVLERGNCDPDLTLAGGAVGLGGFTSLVHGHDLNRKIRIRVTINIADDPQVMERLPGHFGLGADEEFDSEGERRSSEFSERTEFLQLRYFWSYNRNQDDALKTVGVEIEVSWSEFRVAPYLSSLAVFLDDEVLATIKSPPDPGRAVLTEFNLSNRMLQLPDTEDVDANEPDADDVLPGVSQFVKTLLAFSQPVFTPSSGQAWDPAQLSLMVETLDGALPDIAKELKLTCREISQAEFDARVKGVFDSLSPDNGSYPDKRQTWDDLVQKASGAFSEVFDEMFLGPVRIAKDLFERLTYIGPLREIPARKFQPRQVIDESRWAQGLAAWDTLYLRSFARLVGEVNEWLSDESRLGTDYRLEKSDVREIRNPGRFHQLFERGLTEEDLGELKELYEGLSVRSEVALRDMKQGVIVAPGDVGVGVSQVVPVLVACLRDVPGILAIEQPELHLHPAVQVGLGDLMIRATHHDPDRREPKSLLIETHSEHIMLRLLRRIRETAQGELPPGILPLAPADLAVLFVEPALDGVRFQPLHVDRDGEFVERWPRGFFEERDQELF